MTVPRQVASAHSEAATARADHDDSLNDVERTEEGAE